MESLTSTPDGASLEQPENQPTVFSFIFWKHAAIDVPAAAERLGNCDVVVLELIGQNNEAERLRSEELCTAFLSADATAEQKETIRQQFRSIFGHPTVYDDLMEHLAGTGKQMRFMDLLANDPAYELFLEALKNDRVTHMAVNSDKLANWELRGILSQNATFAAAENQSREAAMQQTLMQYAHDMDYTGKRIGVLMGAVHTAVQHMLRRYVQTERHFIHVGEGLIRYPSERAHFPYDRELMRRYRFRPEKAAPDELLDRHLLQILFTRHDVFFMDEDEEDYEEAIPGAIEAVQARHVRHLTAEEVREVLEEIDEIKAEPEPHPNYRHNAILEVLLETADVIKERISRSRKTGTD